MNAYIDPAIERDKAANVYKSQEQSVTPAIEYNRTGKTNHAPPPETYPMGGSRNRVKERGLE